MAADPGEDSHLGRMVKLARMGLDVVPTGIVHATKGPGLLHMNGDGFRFEPFNGEPEMVVLWEEYDKKIASTV